MSLWTPGGEHPVDRGANSPSADPGPAAAPPVGAAFQQAQEQLTPEQEAEAEAMAAEMAQVREQLASVPAAVVVANHAMGLYELAAIHLSQQPPNKPEAKVAIDAFGALVEALQGRLGSDEPVLVDALSQLRLAFVQVAAAPSDASPSAPDSPDDQ